jgi:amino acid transporter
MGMVCYFVMISLGEMGAYLPHKKGFAGYATRYVDPAFGFALGWNYVFKYFIQTTNNVNAAGAVVQYWTLKVPIEAWMGAYLLSRLAWLTCISFSYLHCIECGISPAGL